MSKLPFKLKIKAGKKKIAIRKKYFFAYIKKQAKENKVAFAVYLILRLFVILSMINAVLRADWESLFVCSLSLVLFLLPTFFEKNFGIDIPSLLEIMILLFIFCAEILGELQCYYIKFPYWDTMLHTVNGFICAAIGFSLIDIFNRNKRFKFKMSPMFIVLMSFCFSMTAGVVWEFFEFGCDMIFKTDMQKDTIIHSVSSVMLDPSAANKAVIIDNITDVEISGQQLGLGGYLDIGLIDTVKDLFVNMIGAIVFNIFGFIYLKHRGKGKLIPMLVPVPSTKDKYSSCPEDGESDNRNE